MQTFFDINNVFFTVLGYPMSYLEFFGTIFNIWCVWLTAKNKILSWPIGIVGVVFFTILFWQIRLYSDFFEQIYYFITGFWGWWAWSQGRKKDGAEMDIIALNKRWKIIWSLVTVLGSLLLGYLTSHLHLYFPTYFPEAASFPYLDAFTTVLSFIATILMIKKQIECWYIWILVDVIGIWLYWVKGVHFVSILYVLFLILATRGFINWTRIKHKQTRTV